MASVAFDVKGNRWRVWSSKDLVPEWTGAWSVRVVDAAGNVLADKSFEYTEATMSTPAMEDAMSEAEMKPEETKPAAAAEQEEK